MLELNRFLSGLNYTDGGRWLIFSYQSNVKMKNETFIQIMATIMSTFLISLSLPGLVAQLFYEKELSRI